MHAIKDFKKYVKNLPDSIRSEKFVKDEVARMNYTKLTILYSIELISQKELSMELDKAIYEFRLLGQSKEQAAAAKFKEKIASAIRRQE